MFTKELAPTNIVVTEHNPTTSIRVLCTNNYWLLDERFFATWEEAETFVKENVEAIDLEIKRLEAIKETFEAKAKEVAKIAKKK